MASIHAAAWPQQTEAAIGRAANALAGFKMPAWLQSTDTGPYLAKLRSDLTELKNSTKEFSQAAKKTKPFQNWGESLKKASDNVKDIETKMDKFNAKMDKWNAAGKKACELGEKIRQPFNGLLDDAEKCEKLLRQMSQAGISGDNLKAIREQAEQLSAKTAFSQNELLDMSLTLKRNGVADGQIANVAQSTAQLATLEQDRGNGSAPENAKRFIDMASQLQLLGEPDKLRAFADALNRVAAVSGVSLEQMAAATGKFAATAKEHQVTAGEMTLAQGYLIKQGMSGEVAGSGLSEMLNRLDLTQLSGQERSTRLQAMQQSGLIDAAQATSLQSGNLSLADVGDNAFFRAGQERPLSEMFEQLGKKYREMMAADPQHGERRFQTAMQQTFGSQGQEVALRIAKDQSGFANFAENEKQAKELNAAMQELNQSFDRTFGGLKTKLQNIGIKAAGTALQDFASMMQALEPYVDKFANWANANPQLAALIFKVALGFSTLLTTVGTAQIALAKMGKTLVQAFKLGAAPVKEVIKFASTLKGLHGQFATLRAQGTGFWTALRGAAAATWPTLAKIGSGFKQIFGEVAKLGKPAINIMKQMGGAAKTAFQLMSAGIGNVLKFLARLLLQSTITALRMALNWLIAMGPVGWIIAGVSLIIAAAIAAWETNFCGFRDKVQEIWQNICGWAQQAIQKVGDFISRCMVALGLSKQVDEKEQAQINARGVNNQFLNQYSGNKAQYNVKQYNTINTNSAKEGGETANAAWGRFFDNPQSGKC